jgi:hypothetical protein
MLPSFQAHGHPDLAQQGTPALAYDNNKDLNGAIQILQ